MGWKGTVRSIGAAARAAERDAKRRKKELGRQQKEYDKMQELEQSAYEVNVYQNSVELIQSVHKECGHPVDWVKIASVPKPKKPEKTRVREKEAKIVESSYRPGFLDRLFKGETKKRKKLANQVTQAIKDDELRHKKYISNWEKECKDWSENTPLAKAILNDDAESKILVIKKLDPFSKIAKLGSNLSFSIEESSVIEVTINIHGTDIIPNEVKSLLQSGRLSVKKMPKGQFNELYQDYVCSSILRVARELFSILPDELIFITAVDKLLNSKTGHLEESPILSICVSRNTLNGLNMNRIDPSDSMSNFIHNMIFKKTKGFEIVEKITPKNIQKNS